MRWLAVQGRPWKLVTVRVEAEDSTRAARGWVFTSGVDDGESECGLDSYPHTVVVRNDGTEAELEAQLLRLQQQVEELCR